MFPRVYKTSSGVFKEISMNRKHIARDVLKKIVEKLSFSQFSVIYRIMPGSRHDVKESL